MYKFNQKKIAESLSIDFKELEIGKFGKIFIPDACLEEDAKCNTHFAFHGTEKKFKKMMKYNHFAASNNIIVVYPKSKNAWDVYGEEDENYDT